MKDKKRTGKVKENGKGRIDTPLDQLGEKDTIMHYNAVLIEEMNGQMKLVLEYVAAIAMRLDSVDARLDAMEHRLDAMDAHINARFDALEARVGRLEVAVLEIRHELKRQGEMLKAS